MKTTTSFQDKVITCQRSVRGYIGRCRYRRRRSEAILEAERYWHDVIAAIEKEKLAVIDAKYQMEIQMKNTIREVRLAYVCMYCIV